jgi:hypothetical protein
MILRVSMPQNQGNVLSNAPPVPSLNEIFLMVEKTRLRLLNGFIVSS